MGVGKGTIPPGRGAKAGRLEHHFEVSWERYDAKRRGKALEAPPRQVKS